MTHPSDLIVHDDLGFGCAWREEIGHHPVEMREWNCADGHRAVELQVRPTNLRMGFAAKRPVDLTGLRNGALRFDMRLQDDPMHGLEWRLVVASDGWNTSADRPVASGGNPALAESWRSYSYALDEDLSALDKSAVRFVQFHLLRTDGIPYHYTVFTAARIRNARFEEE